MSEHDGRGQITRRSMLVGGAATAAGIAAGMALPAGAATPAATRSARVGATLNLMAFPSGTTYQQALDMWNAKTQTTMTCWKAYFGPGSFPTKVDALYETMIRNKVRALISVKPAVTPNPDQRAKLDNALAMFRKANLDAEVCLWQEVGPHDMTAGQYHTYVHYYGPTVRKYYPLVFDAPASQGPEEWAAYDPGRTAVDGYALDFYGAAYFALRNQGVSDPLAELAKLAGGKPIGLWEIGNTASGHNVTTSQLEQYMTYLTSFLTHRRSAGLPVGCVAWYNGPHGTGSNVGANEIVGMSPNPIAAADIAAYQKLYHAVNAV